MKKLLLSLTVLISSSAFAADVNPVSCALSFAVHIDSVILFTRGYGNAVASCKNADGSIASQRNMSVVIEGIGPGLGAFDLQGMTQELNLTHARQFQGTYDVAEGAIGIGGIVGTPYYFQSYNAKQSFNAALTAASGAGLRLTGSRWIFTIVR